MSISDLDPYPGGDLVTRGLRDLKRGVVSEEALLVSIAAPRLRRLGLAVPELTSVPQPHEYALFEKIEVRLPRGAHAAYNALVARIVSFANAYGPDSRTTGPTDGAPMN